MDQIQYKPLSHEEMNEIMREARKAQGEALASAFLALFRWIAHPRVPMLGQRHA
ncbi:hypothetical protein O2N63_09085 [Aliiroseovarius sp. KMU-50]|uniref:Uncharacterized protein n=1 Tax=Aliiroseovarius salicola TaxID=3009082 RepID=A0ABT4W161_9RHOB|nr:hypothetical protein [Aliiroseovarius sp. KMU-50]MDA5094241.1 hypothetical protein [Aliiroseovarius sp. KMU-50]